MSHLDPYGSIEPRGRDRTPRPAALPWPERDLEPGAVVRQAYAEQPVTTWPSDRYDQPRPDDRPTLVPGHPDFERAWSGTGPVPDAVDDPYPYHGHQDPYRHPDVEAYPGPGDDPDHRAPATDPGPGPQRPPGRWRGRRRPVRGGGSSAGHGRPSRAGRNLPAAIMVGLALATLIVVPLFFFLEAFLVVLAGAVAVGTWEMARAAPRVNARPPMVPLIAGGVITIGLAWWSGPDALLLGLLVTVLASGVWRIADGMANLGRDMTATTMIAVYVPFLAGFAALLAAAPGDGHLRVVVTLAAVVLSDTGGYAAGANFGKRPMAPTISPKKSWEGFAGSVLTCAIIGGVAMWQFWPEATWWHGAVIGALSAAVATIGDFIESSIKRDLGVKDMGNLLPGHGGVMDRIDSLVMTAPLLWISLSFVVPIA